MIAAGLLPLAAWMILHPDWPVLLSTLFAAILVIYRHKGNLERIQDGTERRFRFGKSA